MSHLEQLKEIGRIRGALLISRGRLTGAGLEKTETGELVDMAIRALELALCHLADDAVDGVDRDRVPSVAAYLLSDDICAEARKPGADELFNELIGEGAAMRYHVTVSISAQHQANHSTPYDTYEEAKKAYDAESGYYVNDGFKRLSKVADDGSIIAIIHETSN